MTREEYIESIKTAFVTISSKAVFSQLVAFSSAFSLPVIGPISFWIIQKVLTVAAIKSETQAFFYYVDIRTDEQASDFVQAAEDYWRNKDGDPDKESASEAILLARFRDLAKFSS
jgi:hypothetical protein